MQRARLPQATPVPTGGAGDHRLRRTQAQLMEAELRIKLAEARAKEVAARRAEDERVHAERMRFLEYSKARRA